MTKPNFQTQAWKIIFQYYFGLRDEVNHHEMSIINVELNKRKRIQCSLSPRFRVMWEKGFSMLMDPWRVSQCPAFWEIVRVDGVLL